MYLSFKHEWLLRVKNRHYMLLLRKNTTALSLVKDMTNKSVQASESKYQSSGNIGERRKCQNASWVWNQQNSVCSHPDRSVQFSSVAQSCPILCDPMNRSTPGLPLHHQLLEFTQTRVHWVSDAIQPSHPLLSPSPPAPNPSRHQSLFQWVNSSHEVAKVLELQL